MSGKTKEAAGKATGDRRLEAEGKTQHETAEGKAKAKTAVDRAKGAVDGIKEAFKKDRH
ncbi:MAG: CsbD family protein [Actinomycetota bacterium]